jgi:hypothetical protein
MKRSCLGAALALALLAASDGTAGDAGPTLMTAQGKVEKVGKDTLTIQPRGPDGRFGKSITLKLVGTSRITLLTAREQAGKTVLMQRDTSARDLQPNQPIAVTYTMLKDGPVLLAAIVQPGK